MEPTADAPTAVGIIVIATVRVNLGTQLGDVKTDVQGRAMKRRARGKTYLWGEAMDLNGNRAESRLQTPEGSTITAARS